MDVRVVLRSQWLSFNIPKESEVLSTLKLRQDICIIPNKCQPITFYGDWCIGIGLTNHEKDIAYQQTHADFCDIAEIDRLINVTRFTGYSS